MRLMREGDGPGPAGDGADVACFSAEADERLVLGVAELDEVLRKALAGCGEGEVAAAAVGSGAAFLAAARGGSRAGAGSLGGAVVVVGAVCVGRPLLDDPDVEDAGGYEAHDERECPPFAC